MIIWLSANAQYNSWDKYYYSMLNKYFKTELYHYNSNLFMQCIRLIFSFPKNTFYIANFATTNGFLCGLTLKRYHLIIYGSDLLLSSKWHRKIRLLIACLLAKSISFSTESEVVLQHSLLLRFNKKFISFPFIRDAAVDIIKHPKSFCTPNDLLSIRNCTPHYQIIEIISLWENSLRCEYKRLVIITAKKDNTYLTKIRHYINTRELTHEVIILDTFLSREEFLNEIFNAGACISMAKTDFLGGPVVDALQLNKKLYVNYNKIYDEYISCTDNVICLDGTFSLKKKQIPNPQTSMNSLISFLREVV